MATIDRPLMTDNDRSIAAWYAAKRTDEHTIPLPGVPAFDDHPMGDRIRYPDEFDTPRRTHAE